MTTAAIHSNRGDYYQTLVAFDWALTVLTDPHSQWLEIDSINYLVDDVVIGKSDGSTICCQCKKNQPQFRAWSIDDLGSELEKASGELARNHQAQVRFYSCSEFGALAKLRDFMGLYGSEAEYLANLTADQKQTDRLLAARISNPAPDLSTYDFLSRTTFVATQDRIHMETLLHERLRYMASNDNAAYDALWTRLDRLGGRIEGENPSVSARHRLTKDDLKEILLNAGSMLAPVMAISEIRASFASTSAIGRSWQRDIAEHRIPNPVLTDIINVIDASKRSILLTGLPGSGKTCVMLSLQESLEQRALTRADLLPLFIQSREFADLSTAVERQAQGLSEQWIEQAARLAENTHVVVVIDSLDTLSIAREHSILDYFLAQIDRLLLIPNITVVTACRDFDRKYDRRIAQRKWDCEFQCQPLGWESEVVPLLNILNIDSSSIDHATRELIRNHRELALFVELAQRDGSFNVVTSQSLAQRYLATIVQADPELGDDAIQAIETIAGEMLSSRSLSLPRQRFNASPTILRRLLSLNVLHVTHDGKLTFGHQTLLDVLVTSGALRRGNTLNQFISDLPPVPFVRPCIRSFVAQLATGDRNEFRKQLRAVWAGSAAFHIRRLVAESFAQQAPHDDDWPLIRDMRNNHREVFQAIYTHASSIEWHHFWLTHLVPILIEMRDAEGMAAHVIRVEQWENMDAAGVCAFWMEALGLDWLDRNRIAEQLVYPLLNLKNEFMGLAAPLIDRLLSLPIPEHTQLGHIVARSVNAGAIDDRALWRFITRDVTGEYIRDLFGGAILHCEPHEFGFNKEDFLAKRMVQSTALLDLAINTIEEWGRIRIGSSGKDTFQFHQGFLDHTSYNDVHSRTEVQITDGERILFDAVETGIFGHAEAHSVWWQNNRERLCFNREGALLHFAIRALTNFPQPNLDMIGLVLCDKELLDSMLSYEVGTLCREAFIYLDEGTQDNVMATIISIGNDSSTENKSDFRIMLLRAEFISTIPCHLRSEQIQSMLEDFEGAFGTIVRQPRIGLRGGMVTAPFSFNVLLGASNDGVIILLDHYVGYTSRDSEDFLTGGEQEVRSQLREASSRQPARFLNLLVERWASIYEKYRNDIMDGISYYLSYRYGNLIADKTWRALEEPDAKELAAQILDELERHYNHWQLNRSASNALEACAYVIQDTANAARLVFLAIDFMRYKERPHTNGTSERLRGEGINMVTGNVAEALMILTNVLHEHDIPLPELLPPTLRRFASHDHPAIRALILERLPFLQNRNPELGWDVFRRATQDSRGLWRSAERCLYCAYHDHYEKVAPLLDRICCEGTKEDMETWGRISALSVLTGQIDLPILIGKMNELDTTEAWQGAMSVWTNIGNLKQDKTLCFSGIEAGLKADISHAKVSVRHVENIFHEITPPVFVPPDLVHLCFSVLENDYEGNKHRLFGFDKWLNAVSERDPEMALAITEIYLDYVRRAKPYFSDYENQVVQLVTRLFAEAEEREESDNGEMLKRVVAVQDTLLSLGLSSIDAWLKSAERP